MRFDVFTFIEWCTRLFYCAIEGIDIHRGAGCGMWAWRRACGWKIRAHIFIIRLYIVGVQQFHLYSSIADKVNRSNGLTAMWQIVCLMFKMHGSYILIIMLMHVSIPRTIMGYSYIHYRKVVSRPYFYFKQDFFFGLSATKFWSQALSWRDYTRDNWQDPPWSCEGGSLNIHDMYIMEKMTQIHLSAGVIRGIISVGILLSSAVSQLGIVAYMYRWFPALCMVIYNHDSYRLAKPFRSASEDIVLLLFAILCHTEVVNAMQNNVTIYYQVHWNLMILHLTLVLLCIQFG